MVVLSCDAGSAEGRHKRAVLETQDHNVWVRLVEVVVECRNLVNLHL